MKNLAALVVAALVSGCAAAAPPAPAPAPASSPADPAEPFARLAVDEVAAKIEKKEPLAIYDANTKETYDAMHLPGAKWIDAKNVSSADLPADKQAALLFYCGNESCRASHHAARAAVGLGYAHVSVMPAGIIGWKRAGKPIEK